MIDSEIVSIPERFGRQISLGPLKNPSHTLKFFLIVVIASFAGSVYILWLFPVILSVGSLLIFFKKEDYYIDEYIYNYLLFKFSNRVFIGISEVKNFVGKIRIVEKKILEIGGVYYSIIEIEGISYTTLRDDEKIALISGFQHFLNLIDNEMYFITTTIPADSLPFYSDINRSNVYHKEYMYLLKETFAGLYIPKYYIIIPLNYNSKFSDLDNINEKDRDERALKDLTLKKEEIIHALSSINIECIDLEGIELYDAIENIFVGGGNSGIV